MTSVGTSLPYSTLDDESNELNRLKKRIHAGRTMTRTKKSKNKTRKKSNQVESMLDYIRQHDEEKEKNDLEESFDMLKPTLSRNTHEDDEDSTTSEDDKPEFLRKRETQPIRPLLDDSQSNDPIQFHDPKRYASLVKEYGSDMLKPWSAQDGGGQVPSDQRRQQVQQRQDSQPSHRGSHEGFAGLFESNQLYAENSSIERNSMVEKMNYMIHLLEDQKDSRTESVNEELILYLFLGIFVIFVTDSFTRVGKYTR